MAVVCARAVVVLGVAGIVGRVTAVLTARVAQFAADEPVLIHARDIGLRDIGLLAVRDGLEFVARDFLVAVDGDENFVLADGQEEVAVRAGQGADGQMVHDFAERVQGSVIQLVEQPVFAERDPEAGLQRIKGHGRGIYGRENVVQRVIHIVVEVGDEDGEVGIFLFEPEREELVHIAEGHVVDHIAEMIGDLGYGIVEQHRNVDAAYLLGQLEPVLFAEEVDGDARRIGEIAHERHGKIEKSLTVRVARVVDDIRAHRVLYLSYGDHRQRDRETAAHGDDEQHHADQNAYDETCGFHITSGGLSRISCQMRSSEDCVRRRTLR